MQSATDNIKQIRDRLTIDLRSLIQHELDSEGRDGLYILLAGVDPGVSLDSSIRGLTCPFMGEVYRDSIEGYRGNGPCMILQADADILEFSTSAVHEIAHRLAAETLCEDLPSPSYAVATRAFVGQADRYDFSPDAETFEARLIAAREDHGPAFVRMAVHVASRMRDLNWPITTHGLMLWGEVTRTSPNEFFNVLQDEVDDLRNEPLSAIKSIDPPSCWGSLFEPPANFRPLFERVSTMKFLQLKKQTAKVREAAARDRLKQLRVDIADDVEIDGDEVESIMRDMDISFEEIEQQVAELKRRRKMVATIEQGKWNATRAAKIDEQIQQAEDEFAVVLQQHQYHVAKLQSEKVGLTDHYPAHNAELSLRRGAKDPEFIATKGKLSRQKSELGRRKGLLEKQQRHHKDSARMLEIESDRQTSKGATPSSRLAQEIAVHQGKQEALGLELKSLSEAIDDLEAQLEELRARELDPNNF